MFWGLMREELPGQGSLPWLFADAVRGARTECQGGARGGSPGQFVTEQNTFRSVGIYLTASIFLTRV